MQLRSEAKERPIKQIREKKTALSYLKAKDIAHTFHQVFAKRFWHIVEGAELTKFYTEEEYNTRHRGNLDFGGGEIERVQTDDVELH
jgi:predicted cupin superfamily sugar epimerase